MGTVALSRLKSCGLSHLISWSSSVGRGNFCVLYAMLFIGL